MKRDDFPILSKTIYGRHPLVYLDNAGTTQKPRQVIEAMTEEYYNLNANVHRGVHFLSQQATELHEQSREKVRAFINARSTSEIVFTRGTTESINLVASSMAKAFCREGDEVIVSAMEHHSNIVPWQLQGLRVKPIPLRDDLSLDVDRLPELITPRTKLISVTHVSNVLGVTNDIRRIADIAHAHGLPLMVDGAQSTPHMSIDVQALGADFFAFSGHKLYGPTGIGVLYGREDWLDRLPPYMGGGEMIKNVTFERTTFNELPFKFEAGTPDYIATTGLGAAIDYVSAIGMDSIARHERELTAHLIERLNSCAGLHTYLCPEGTTGVVPFNIEGAHPLDVGTLLDRLGIAIRTGHHCAEPLVKRLGVESTCRASLALYNTPEDIDALAEGIERIRPMLIG